MRLLPSLLLAALLAACQAAPAPAPKAAEYRLVDLTPIYSRIFDRTADLTTDQRIAALRAELAPAFPQFYRARPTSTPESEADFDARLRTSLNAFPAIRPKYEAVSRGFAGMIDGALVSFRKSLPDLKPIGDVYLLNSLNEMDGGTRTYDGVTYFVFGADMMAQIHAPSSEQPFFHHELFHIYHRQFFKSCYVLWCGLWTEGLAVLAAQELNPGASDQQLLLNVPAPIRPAVDANLVEAVCAVRARFQSLSPDDSSALFTFKRLNDRLPARFGYYVGLMVATEARKTHSLQELAHLDTVQARAVVDAALAKLATCPA